DSETALSPAMTVMTSASVSPTSSSIACHPLLVSLATAASTQPLQQRLYALDQRCRLCEASALFIDDGCRRGGYELVAGELRARAGHLRPSLRQTRTLTGTVLAEVYLSCQCESQFDVGEHCAQPGAAAGTTGGAGGVDEAGPGKAFVQWRELGESCPALARRLDVDVLGRGQFCLRTQGARRRHPRLQPRELRLRVGIDVRGVARRPGAHRQLVVRSERLV